LFRLKNRISRSTVGKKPKCNLYACEDFLEVLIVGHILTAASEVLGMQNIEDEQCADASVITSLEILWTQANKERKAMMRSTFEILLTNLVYCVYCLKHTNPSRSTRF